MRGGPPGETCPTSYLAGVAVIDRGGAPVSVARVEAGPGGSRYRPPCVGPAGLMGRSRVLVPRPYPPARGLQAPDLTHERRIGPSTNQVAPRRLRRPGAWHRKGSAPSALPKRQ